MEKKTARRKMAFYCTAIIRDYLILWRWPPVALAAVYKKEWSNVPVLKEIFACTKSFAMDREDARQSLTVIRARNSLIFPEGTRSKHGNVMGEFHSGSFQCALSAKCPTVPFVLMDRFKVLDQKGSKPASVQLYCLKPIAYEEYKDARSVELSAIVEGNIKKILNQID